MHDREERGWRVGATATPPSPHTGLMRPPTAPVLSRARALAAIAVFALIAALFAVSAPPASAAQQTPTVASTGSADTTDDGGTDAADATVTEDAVPSDEASDMAGDGDQSTDTELDAQADLSGFKPGRIIADELFYTSGTMTEAQIQAFLNDKVPSCRSGYVCLKDFKQDTSNKAADQMCSGYAGARGESAARIIFKVSQSCGINAQVLLVMLQKEQGLVLHTWPSDWRYGAAMGQGCPDDAGCDPGFAGFFNQVYGGSWQLKRYGNPAGTSNYFTWYPVGAVSSVRYHPDASCGSSPVRIENKATAALYYYTPYQPNAAALRAGYGTGDSCSAYGNRNFFHYFTDWFGSTAGTPQTPTTPAIADGKNVRVGADIYFVSGSRSYHIANLADWNEFRAAFGQATTISAADLAKVPTAGQATRVLRNASTGVISYLSGGQLHRFGSCALVATWAGSCGSRIDVPGDVFARVATGSEMTAFASVNGLTALLEGDTVRSFANDNAARAYNGGAMPYAASISPTHLAAKRVLGFRTFEPGVFIAVSGDPKVYLPTANGTLLYVPDWNIVRDSGLAARTGARVAAADIAGYGTATFTPFVRCGGTVYIAGGGRVRAIDAGQVGDVPIADLDDRTCGTFPSVGSAITGGVYVKASDGKVYRVAGGALHIVPSRAFWAGLVGSDNLVASSWSAASVAAVQIGQGYPNTAQFVRAWGTATVYLVNATTLVPVPSWTIPRAYGWRAVSTQIDAALIDTMAKSATLTEIVRCGQTLYRPEGGRAAVISAAPAGAGITDLAPSTCAALGLG